MSKALKKFLSLIIVCGVVTFSGGTAMADSDEQKLATVNAMLDAWNKLDWERAINMFAEDGVLHSMMIEPVKGRDIIGARLRELGKGASKIDLQVKNMGIINGLVFVERVDDFVYNGNHGRVPVVGVLDIQDGKVKEWREYYDLNQLKTAMGEKPN